LKPELETKRYKTRSDIKAKMCRDPSPFKMPRKRKMDKSPESTASSLHTQVQLDMNKRITRSSPPVLKKKHIIEADESKVLGIITVKTEQANSSRKQNGPLPAKNAKMINIRRQQNGPMSAKNAKQLMKAMIHSPFHLQVSTASNVMFDEVSVREDLTISGLKARIDSDALHLMPDDLPSTVYTHGVASFPIIIEGDGNCLARVGSVLLFGTEAHHLEVRLRIATEMVLFRDCYLDQDYLSKGLPANQHLSPAMIAQFSETYVGEHLNADAVQNIFLKEVHQVLRPSSYMGLWQLFAMASVLKLPLFSA
jgi:hypothetical protein